jgi:hypothetical protein
LLECRSIETMRFKNVCGRYGGALSYGFLKVRGRSAPLPVAVRFLMLMAKSAPAQNSNQPAPDRSMLVGYE